MPRFGANVGEINVCARLDVSLHYFRFYDVMEEINTYARVSLTATRLL